jgi:hypothetical protein
MALPSYRVHHYLVYAAYCNDLVYVGYSGLCLGGWVDSTVFWVSVRGPRNDLPIEQSMHSEGVQFGLCEGVVLPIFSKYVSECVSNLMPKVCHSMAPNVPICSNYFSKCV